MTTFFRSLLFTFLAVLILIGSFFSGYAYHAYLARQDTNLRLVEEAYSYLGRYGLYEFPPDPALEYGMIRGMVQAYGDPHTVFVEPVQHEINTNDLQGSYGGVGVELVRDSEGSVLLYPFPDGPAARAGLLDGDHLLAIDDLDIDRETSLDIILVAMRGPIGTSVSLSILRPPDTSPMRFTLQRETIPLPSVSWFLAPMEPRVGVIKINLIGANTPDEIQQAVEELQARRATHFVLDLRDNGGGLLASGVDIALLFLSDGVVIQQQYRGKQIETFSVNRRGPLADIPLAATINHGTASAAEIVSGALKAHNRALLVGHPTFGKDSMQLVFELSDHSSLHVSAGQWWVPGLDPPVRQGGVQPDIFVSEDSSEPDATLKAAVKALMDAP